MFIAKQEPLDATCPLYIGNMNDVHHKPRFRGFGRTWSASATLEILKTILDFINHESRYICRIFYFCNK